MKLMETLSVVQFLVQKSINFMQENSLGLKFYLSTHVYV